MHQGSQPQQEPPYVLRAAVTHKLGPLHTIHEPGREAYIYRFVSLFSIIVGCLIILFFFVSYDSLFSSWLLWQAALIPLVGVTWLVLAAWIFLTPYIYPRLRIFVYRDGLIYVRGKAEVLRWNQMERVWKDFYVGRKGPYARSYTVRRSDDVLFVFTAELKNVEALGRLIEIEITRRLLPRALASYQTGGPVVFDEIVVSSRGIGVKSGRKLLFWDDFGRLSIDEKKIALYKKSMDAAWTVLNVANVPNVEVLKELIAHIQREMVMAQLPHIVDYNAGRVVTFGALQVSMQGVSIDNGNHLLPWSEIASIGVGECEVILRREDRVSEWYALPLWKVTGIVELKELINYIVYGKV
jgi:hypothetical protein